MENELSKRMAAVKLEATSKKQLVEPLRLKTLDSYLLKAVLSKTEALSFVRLMRTCRLVKEVVDSVSSWQIPFPEATLVYLAESKFAIHYKEHNKQRIPSQRSNACTEFFSFPIIYLTECKPDFLHNMVFPEIRRMKGVQQVRLNYTMQPADLERLVSILEVRKLTLEYQDCHYRETNTILKRIKTIKVAVHPENLDSYYGATKVFALLKGRDKVTLSLPEVAEGLICDIIQVWLKGHNGTGLDTLVLAHENPQNFEGIKSNVMRQIGVDSSFQELIYGMYDPEGSAGSTISNQQILARNPRYGSGRLLLRFAEETVLFQFQS